MAYARRHGRRQRCNSLEHADHLAREALAQSVVEERRMKMYPGEGARFSYQR